MICSQSATNLQRWRHELIPSFTQQVSGESALPSPQPLHEPVASEGAGPPWESGAEDARTPSAGASSGGAFAVAERLECGRFIGAFGPAWINQWFMVPMRDVKIVEATHEPHTQLVGNQPSHFQSVQGRKARTCSGKSLQQLPLNPAKTGSRSTQPFPLCLSFHCHFD